MIKKDIDNNDILNDKRLRIKQLNTRMDKIYHSTQDVKYCFYKVF